MQKLTVFNQTSLDGFIADRYGDMSWAHRDDPEWTDFAAANARGGGRLLLGRITCDLMAAFWPTPIAHQVMPEVAESMNALPKTVVSRTMIEASWNNTTVLRGDLAEEVRRLKREPGGDIVILGSGSIVSQLASAGLIDEYQIVLVPVVLGDGKSMFEGVGKTLPLKLLESRRFGNGNVLVRYEPE